MRLLGSLTKVPTLYEFFIGEIPPYVILSHTWGKDEVTLQDLQNGKACEMAGYSKIKRCCAQAVLGGYQYVWIDTCCIDKTSSAELSEAINSMFQWYQSAHVCYAYLSDVSSGETWTEFRQSRWFTRGWTLQELIAPEAVVFFDRNWVEIGTRAYLSTLISSITGIENIGNLDIGVSSIAQKMFWASRRETTRVEDQAYCLLGIFGVHMPLLYGEGKNAFKRLQEEILKVSTDESIFAWGYLRFGPSSSLGMLASSPSQFKESGDVVEFLFDKERLSHTITNRGLRMKLYLHPVNPSLSQLRPNSGLKYSLVDHRFSKSPVVAPLNCKRSSSGHIVGVLLEQVDSEISFRRASSSTMDLNPIALKQEQSGHKLDRKPIYVRAVQETIQWWRPVGFKLQIHQVLENGFIGYESKITSSPLALGDEIADGSEYEIETDPRYDFPGRFTFIGRSDSFVVELQIARTSSLGAQIYIVRSNQSREQIKTHYAREAKDQGTTFDRVSKRLPSGKCAAVTVKRFPNAAKLHQLQQFYLVDITIEPEGKLLWPDLNQ